MTAILAYADGEHVWMAGDSAIAENTWRRKTVLRKKVFCIGDMLIGGAGSVRACEVVEEYYPLTTPHDDHDPYIYLLKVFIPEVTRVLKEHNASMIGDDYTTSFLVGVQGRLFEISGDFSVNPLSECAFAIGHGGDLALGAFLMGRALNDSPDQIEAHLLTALRIAAQRNLAVAPPFYIEKV